VELDQPGDILNETLVATIHLRLFDRDGRDRAFTGVIGIDAPRATGRLMTVAHLLYEPIGDDSTSALALAYAMAHLMGNVAMTRDESRPSTIVRAHSRGGGAAAAWRVAIHTRRGRSDQSRRVVGRALTLRLLELAEEPRLRELPVADHGICRDFQSVRSPLRQAAVDPDFITSDPRATPRRCHPARPPQTRTDRQPTRRRGER
jgi:hypothetical protein